MGVEIWNEVIKLFEKEKEKDILGGGRREVTECRGKGKMQGKRGDTSSVGTVTSNAVVR